MVRLLALTGLRVSELLALQWRHLRLDGSGPAVRVRRAIPRGRVEPPKSRYGRRDVPLDVDLVSELRRHRQASEWPGDEDLVFPSLRGTPLNPENLRRDVIRPAREEIGAPWVSFHTFRHTCAAMLFDRGLNVKQVQRWLGHHSASFTLNTYIHLLDERLPAPLSLEQDTQGVTGLSGCRLTDPWSVKFDGTCGFEKLVGPPPRAGFHVRHGGQSARGNRRPPAASSSLAFVPKFGRRSRLRGDASPGRASEGTGTA